MLNVFNIEHSASDIDGAFLARGPRPPRPDSAGGGFVDHRPQVVRQRRLERHRPAVGRVREHQARGVQERPLELLHGAHIVGHAAGGRRRTSSRRRSGGRSRSGGRESGACGRSRSRPAAARRRAGARACVTRVTASARAAPAPTSSADRPDRVRSARRSGARPAPRPTRARCIPFRPRDRGTAAPAPGARHRSWRPPSRPTCRDRAGARCPGRSSPPMPLRSSTWWSSALTSVPRRMARRRMHDHPGRLVDDDEVGVLIEDGERQRPRLRRRRLTAAGMSIVIASARSSTGGFGRSGATGAATTWPSLISRWICERDDPAARETRKRSRRSPSCFARRRSDWCGTSASCALACPARPASTAPAAPAARQRGRRASRSRAARG